SATERTSPASQEENSNLNDGLNISDQDYATGDNESLNNSNARRAYKRTRIMQSIRKAGTVYAAGNLVEPFLIASMKNLASIGNGYFKLDQCYSEVNNFPCDGDELNSKPHINLAPDELK
ncbi:unnamed protein product, partial [Rotaria magnacalcarata]